MQSSSSQISSPSPSPSTLTTGTLTTSTSNDIDITVTDVTDASPDSSPPQEKSSPFHTTDNSNPFLTSDRSGSTTPSSDFILLRDKGLKHCISDTNLNKLKQEYKPILPVGHLDALITRSEEDLGATVGEPSPRHCIATKPARAPQRNGKSAKQHSDDDRLSKSSFFVKLDEWEMFETAGTKISDNSLPRAHSTETSPTQDRKGTSKYGSKHRLEFLNPSGIRAITSKVNVRSPELSGRQNRKGRNHSRDRSKSSALLQNSVKLGTVKSSQWVNRYRPGVAVPVPGETARESIMQSELRHREKEFCSPVMLRYVQYWASI